MRRRLGGMTLGLLVWAMPVWPMPVWAQAVTLRAPAETAGAAKLDEAASCLLPCGNAARGTLSGDGERDQFRKCVLRRLCAASATGPSRPVARPPLPMAHELPDDLRTRPLKVLPSVMAPGRP